MKRARANGFTLMELLVVVAIVGILLAIAVPNYNDYIRRASRSAAQSELLELASIQEKIFLNSSAYACGSNNPLACANMVTTAYNGGTTGGLGRTSGTTQDGKYTLSVTPGGGTTYTLTATPVTGSTQAGDGNISINEAGRRLRGTAVW